MNLSEEIIARVAAWAESHRAISEIWLFGSRARGSNRPDSDADLAVRMPGETTQVQGLYQAKADEWQAELGAIAGLPISLQILDYSDELDEIVNREGLQIWARTAER